MAELPDDVYKQCRKVLSRCDQFQSDEALRAVFVTRGLSVYRDRVPHAQARQQRVDQCISFLLDQQMGGGSVLPVFLEVLAAGYEPDDDLRKDLDDLAQRVRTALTSAPSVTPRVGSAGSDPDTVFRAVSEGDTRPSWAEPESDAGSATQLEEKEYNSDSTNVLLAQIEDPFIRQLEERLRMDNRYWQAAGWPVPPSSQSFTKDYFENQARYFAHQAAKLVQLRDQTQALQSDLHDGQLGTIPATRQARDIITDVIEHSGQIRQLLNTTPYHPRKVTIDKAAAYVIEAAGKTQRAILDAARAAVGAQPVPDSISDQVEVWIRTLDLALTQLEKQMQDLGQEARNATAFLR
jgi:hypothetical protein